jgi:predicted DNA-binding transcriptional regulator YafY
MPSGFNVDEAFATSFGIYLTDKRGETIRFRVHGTEARYLRDLPIHSSQKEIVTAGQNGTEAEGYATFEIFVYPNTALIMEFCKYGSRMEVLSPAHVRDDVAKELRRAASLYTEAENHGD